MSTITRAASLHLTVVFALAACTPAAPDPTQTTPAFSNAGAPAQHGDELAALRQVTAAFSNIDKARDAGWNTPITNCWQHSTHGAMGFHYGKPAIIDGTVNLLEPEALMYEPNASGQLRLVGMEYIVPLASWSAPQPPQLLGQNFTQHPTLPIYKLHIWLWRNNPAGLFADWNPKVSCDATSDTQIFQ